MSAITQTDKKSKNWVKAVIVIVFLILAVTLAIYTYNTVQSIVASWDITEAEGLKIATPTPTLAPGETPQPTSENPEVVAPPSIATPEPWDGASRVTVLLIGLDYNDWRGEDGSPRSDTMILLTLDPLSQTAGILTIPRDLWVNIPGFGYGKINTAYQLGDSANLPGGGPGLAMETVEYLIGVPIDYYAQIDFSAFVRFIDEIYGIKICVDEEIRIDIYDDGEGLKTVEAGCSVLPGSWALAYARARNTEGGDFDRSRRQQQVIMAIRDRILDRNIFPKLLPKAPTLYNEIASGINTNLNFDQALQLGFTALQIPEEKIYQGVIGSEHINFGTSPDGLDVLKPLSDKIRELRDEIFNPVEISPVLADNPDPLTLMVEENARISILNGTFTQGLASVTQEYLTGLGANIQDVGDAADKPYPYTVIYDYTGNPYTVQYFVELMGISQYRIYTRFDPEKGVDVTIILGDDWAYNNPMP